MSEGTYGNAGDGGEGSVAWTLIVNLEGEHTIYVWKSKGGKERVSV